MSRITKLLSFAVLFSFGLATEKNEETTVDKTAVVEENKSESVTVDQETTPINIEKINKIRLTRAKLDSRHAHRVLHKIKTSDKNSELLENKDIKQADIVRKIKESISASFQTVQVKNINGERVIDLPNANETN
ncbi:uncharacterized protein METZ01_LOCUS339321 [marine metagenome]|uniref:Uncharacterized protein n=1 Tax=marine metagenome TaxID=408172 RepID=A0A382QNE1_9ZZZZ